MINLVEFCVGSLSHIKSAMLWTELITPFPHYGLNLPVLDLYNNSNWAWARPLQTAEFWLCYLRRAVTALGAPGSTGTLTSALSWSQLGAEAPSRCAVPGGSGWARWGWSSAQRQSLGFSPSPAVGPGQQWAQPAMPCFQLPARSAGSFTLH